jgi:hypothetical protein
LDKLEKMPESFEWPSAISFWWKSIRRGVVWGIFGGGASGVVAFFKEGHETLKLLGWPIPVPELSLITGSLVFTLIALAKGSCDLYSVEKAADLTKIEELETTLAFARVAEARTLAQANNLHINPPFVRLTYKSSSWHAYWFDLGPLITEYYLLFFGTGGTAYNVQLQPIAGMTFDEVPILSEGEEIRVPFRGSNFQQMIDRIWELNVTAAATMTQPFTITYTDKTLGGERYRSEGNLILQEGQLSQITTPAATMLQANT